MKNLIEKLKTDKKLEKAEWVTLIQNHESVADYAQKTAYEIKRENFGDGIFIRGLIEISSYCKNNCLYCGIRAGNKKAQRYRLEKEDILACAKEGHELGFRTFVMQGGEDSYFTDEVLCDIISQIKNLYPDSAITLSLGERSRESYEKLYKAGADRYLLRHETATKEHYKTLHPEVMSFERRMQCLKDLKETGFQVGCGFMVGSPNQTAENLAEDMIFISEFKPHMVGIGPFLQHCDTPFAEYPNGSVDMTVFLLSLIRIMLPKVLLPATTALATLAKDGRERGIMAGANVVMPNLSPLEVRKKYMLYDNKIATDTEAAEGLEKLVKQMEKIGSRVEFSRGDSPFAKIR